MNRIVQLTLACFLLSGSLFAQKGIGINDPNPQAALHIVSPDKGVLLPQISLTTSTTFLGGATATASHTGMLVYNTNTATNTGLLGEGYYFWNSTHWERFQGSADALTDLDNDTKIQVEETGDDDTIRFDTAGTEILRVNTSDTFIYNDVTIGDPVYTVIGTPEVILTSANPSGFEAYNSANVTEYNGSQSNGASSTLFNSTFESGSATHRLVRVTAGVDWGVGYNFNNTYNFTSIRFRSRPDCCSNRTAGGEIRIYNKGTLIATSPIVADPGIDAWTTAYMPNNIGDEVRYIFPNGADSAAGNLISIAEFEIEGQQTIGVGPGQLRVTGSTTFEGLLIDGSGDAGTAGQILSSTGTSTNWIDSGLIQSTTPLGTLTNTVSVSLDGIRSVFVQGNYAYVIAFNDDAFQVIDISDPASPVGVGQLTGGGLELDGATGVFVQGNYAYVAAQADDGLQVIDISDPTSPVGVGQLTDGGGLELDGASGVFVQGNYAYVASNADDGFQVIDISDPTNPVGVGQLTDGGGLALEGAFSVFIQGNYAYVASEVDHGLQVIDISDPTNPVGVGQLTDGGDLELEGASSVFVQGKYAYVASAADDGFQVIDISDPTNPVGVGQLTDGGNLELNGARSVFVQGNYAYVASVDDDGFQVIDISDPTNPVGIDQLTDGGSLELNGAFSVFVQGNYAYVVAQADDGFQVIQLGSSNQRSTLEIGALNTSSIQVDNHAQFNNYVDVKGGLSVGASAKVDGSLSVGGRIKASSVDFSGLPVYADEAAAASLPSGYLYQTSTGEIRIKL